MKFIDLYAGIGGFRYALEELGNECVFSAEVNKYSIETYKQNFGDNAFFDMDSIKNMSDKEINEAIPDHDILVGGFPCQSFSIAGKKLGFKTEDTRGTQFFNILRILEVKKPSKIILENVKHLIKHDNGNTFKIIKSSLKKLGYNLPEDDIILSPKDLGINQSRERIFIVGDKENEIKKIKKPNISLKKFRLRKVERTNLSTFELNFIKAWEEFIKGVKRENNNGIPVIWIDEMLSDDPIVNLPGWKIRYIERMREFYKINKKFIDSWVKKHNVTQWGNKKYRKLEWSSGDSDSDLRNGKHLIIRPSGLRVRNKDYFPTLVASIETPIVFDKNINEFRFLTTREVADLQSFPSKMQINKNEKEAYKQFGNAVNVDVVKWLVKEIFE